MKKYDSSIYLLKINSLIVNLLDWVAIGGIIHISYKNTKKVLVMPTPFLMQYLEKEIFFPVLNASPENFPGQREELESVQLGVIDMLHNLYYPCKTPEAMRQSIIISLVAPNLRTVWSQLQNLGFLKIDESVWLN